MRAGAGGFALATDLAEYLVARGVPFREAHEAVAALVRDAAAAKNLALGDLTLEDLRRYSPKFGHDAVAMLTVDDSLRVRNLPGGPAPETVHARIRSLRARRGPQQ
jgi:argininosuccinate lyase